VRIDHAIYATADLDAAAARVAAELGVEAAGGGRHDGLGTHNRIVPLGGGTFIELLAVADPDEARRSSLGSALAAAIARGEGLLAWAVAVADVEAVAARLGTTITPVGRQGRTARLTALAEALATPCLPFFIERAAVAAASSPAIRWIEVAGDRARIEEWLGGAELPLRVVTGEPRVLALGVGARELRAGQTWS
jgi:hypothetical protein